MTKAKPCNCEEVKDITQSELKFELTYDDETGIFTRNYSKGRFKKDAIAGHVAKIGYSLLRVNTKLYYAHRLAFLYMTGVWPKNHVDHKNRIKSDNRWSNLREATASENIMNAGLRKNNKSGHTGVRYNKHAKKYAASITLNKKSNHIGYFENIDSAINAYKEKAIEYFGEFYHEQKTETQAGYL